MATPGRVLEDLLAAVNDHDLGRIGACAPGNERLGESFRRLLTAFPDVAVDVEWTVAEADRGVAWAHLTGTHRGEWRGFAPTGRPIDVRGVFAVQVDDSERVTDFWLVNDWLGIATQLGAELVPPPA